MTLPGPHAHALCEGLCCDSATSAERISFAVHLRVAMVGSSNKDFILYMPGTIPWELLVLTYSRSFLMLSNTGHRKR